MVLLFERYLFVTRLVKIMKHVYKRPFDVFPDLDVRNETTERHGEPLALGDKDLVTSGFDIVVRSMTDDTIISIDCFFVVDNDCHDGIKQGVTPA